jgi:hypothetical protein
MLHIRYVFLLHLPQMQLRSALCGSRQDTFPDLLKAMQWDSPALSCSSWFSSRENFTFSWREIVAFGDGKSPSNGVLNGKIIDFY